MNRHLREMVVVITGASAGIGRALAMELGNRGARLLLASRRLDRLEQVNSKLGGNHACVEADVSCSDDCRRIIDTAMVKFGRIDTLVCNAGYALARPFDQMDAEEIRQIFATNLFGTTECCRLAIPIMKHQEMRDGYRGQLMIVSSACARRGLPYFSTYAATKAAQLSLAEGLRIELLPSAIAVTSIHPVATESDFFTVADQMSGIKTAALRHGKIASSAQVAASMARAIEKPRRELWPKPFSRLSLLIASALPAVVDRVMCGIRDNLVRDNAPSSVSEEPSGAKSPLPVEST